MPRFNLVAAQLAFHLRKGQTRRLTWSDLQAFPCRHRPSRARLDSGTPLARRRLHHGAAAQTIYPKLGSLMTSYALEADNLVKRYGPRLAVNQISFKIPQGAIYGVLGPNGAGKSSTLRMLVGVLRPTAGNITLLGGPITRKTLRRIGYLPEERGLYRNMSARAAIAYLARLKGMGAGKAFKRADQLLERHGLGAVRRKKLKTLS
jgi:ABC-type glutathione transport system ATPase component